MVTTSMALPKNREFKPNTKIISPKMIECYSKIVHKLESDNTGHPDFDLPKIII